MEADPCLTVDDVMRRYPNLRTRRAARKHMDDVGSFPVAGKLYVRLADLFAYEEAQIAARRPGAAPSPPARSGPARRPQKRPSGPLPPLAPDWHVSPLDRS